MNKSPHVHQVLTAWSFVRNVNPYITTTSLLFHVAFALILYTIRCTNRLQDVGTGGTYALCPVVQSSATLAIWSIAATCGARI